MWCHVDIGTQCWYELAEQHCLVSTQVLYNLVYHFVSSLLKYISREQKHTRSDMPSDVFKRFLIQRHFRDPSKVPLPSYNFKNSKCATHFLEMNRSMKYVSYMTKGAVLSSGVFWKYECKVPCQDKSAMQEEFWYRCCYFKRPRCTLQNGFVFEKTSGILCHLLT